MTSDVIDRRTNGLHQTSFLAHCNAHWDDFFFFCTEENGSKHNTTPCLYEQS